MAADELATADSARKLAAVIWRRQIKSAGNAYPNSHCICNLKNSRVHKNHLHIQHELTNSAMEKSTKWDQPTLSLNEKDIYLHCKRSQTRVEDLMTECDQWQKKLHHLCQKTLMQREERESLRIILKRERRERRLQESLNSKLAADVAAAEAADRKHRHEYKEEKKAREFMEETLEHLIEESRKTKEEIKFLKKEIMEICEEADMEKRMLQEAEAWREERVRMKIMDAKMVLEEKHLQFCETWPDSLRKDDDDDDDDDNDDDDDDSSTEETMSRSDELDSSVPSV